MQTPNTGNNNSNGLISVPSRNVKSDPGTLPRRPIGESKENTLRSPSNVLAARPSGIFLQEDVEERSVQPKTSRMFALINIFNFMWSDVETVSSEVGILSR